MLVALIVTPLIGCRQTKLRAGKVTGSSMGPNIPGEHYLASCGECGFELTCDIEQADQRQHLVCSNCGDTIELSTCIKQAAAAVEIQSSESAIERWDVVAFRLPTDLNPSGIHAAGIKRVVGLPGESIEIRKGNILVNGNIIRKNLAQQKAVRIPVHDSFYRSNENCNWAFEDESGWRLDSSFVFVPSRGDNQTHWLSYSNQRNYSHPKDKTSLAESFPIEDFYAFNQSLSRDLNPTDEVFVALDARVSKGGRLAWRFDHRGTLYEFQIDTGRLELNVTSTEAEFQPKTVSLDPRHMAKPDSLVEFSSFDLQLMVWINGKEVFRLELAESDRPVSRQLLKFGGANDSLAINRIRIWRDLYYFPDPVGSSRRSTVVSQNGFFVIGDNVPISLDSRHWKTPSLQRSEIIGKVKLP